MCCGLSIVKRDHTIIVDNYTVTEFNQNILPAIEEFLKQSINAPSSEFESTLPVGKLQIWISNLKSIDKKTQRLSNNFFNSSQNANPVIEQINQSVCGILAKYNIVFKEIPGLIFV